MQSDPIPVPITRQPARRLSWADESECEFDVGWTEVRGRGTSRACLVEDNECILQTGNRFAALAPRRQQAKEDFIRQAVPQHPMPAQRP